MAARYLAIPLALVIAGCAERIPDPGNGDWIIKAGYAHSPPPERFQRDYLGELTIHRVAREAIGQTCDAVAVSRGGTPFNVDMVGCAVAGAGFCDVVIPSEVVTVIAGGQPFPMTPEAVLFHEMGHCNGWGPNHEN